MLLELKPLFLTTLLYDFRLLLLLSILFPLISLIFYQLSYGRYGTVVITSVSIRVLRFLMVAEISANILGLGGIGISYLVFIFVQIHESIFKVVTVDFRNKVWVVFNEINQEIWHIFVILVRDQNIHVGLLLHIFGQIISFITLTGLIDLSIKNSSFEKLFNIFFLSFEIFHVLFVISKHLDFEACAKKSFQVLWSVTLEHPSVLKNTNSRPNVICLLYVLSRYKNGKISLSSKLLYQLPNYLARSKIQVRCRLVQYQ